MLIQKHLVPYVVYSDDPIVHALQKISRNRSQVVYCVSQHGILEGIVTDGDFRRWIVGQDQIDLDQPIAQVANTAYVAEHVDTPSWEIAERLSDRIKSLPLVDDRGRLVAIAWPATHDFAIAGREIGDHAPVFVIAEIGNNHNGDLDLALELVDAAADAGADAAKFQMRDMEALYISSEAARRQGRDLGDEYTLDLLSRFQLTDDELFAALEHARSRGLVALCTPWDHQSLKRLDEYGLPAYKIASADLTNHDLLRAAAETDKPLIVSTGMSDETEIVSAAELLKRLGAPFVMLHCNSTYPAPTKDVQLRYLDRLRDIAGGPVGYSGHERGIHVAVAAVARGARILEKHLTLDRSMEGNDHRASLLPKELADLVDAVREVDTALGSSSARTMTQGERLNREVLAKSLVAAVPIEPGTTITSAHIEVRSPGRGLSPQRRDELIGREADRSLDPGDFFFPSDLAGRASAPRHYEFARPFGVPVRFHDYRDLSAGTNLDLVEFHLSYRDLSVEAHSAVGEPASMGLVVHAPELFSGDHVLDLSSEDEDYRNRSLGELRRVIDLTLAIRDQFTSERPGIVVNVGGFTLDSPLPLEDRRIRYERVAEALAEVDDPGVELWPQTMPPFPWHFGGQRFHNLLVEPGEIVDFCESTGRRICLDVSHTALASHHLGTSLSEAIKAMAPHVAHLHLADAAGRDGEGLQIGDGDVDFAAVADALQGAAGASFIPEIWQGHKNDGEGFWTALSRLERWF